MFETIIDGQGLFGPVLAQVILTLAVSVLLYARRLPALAKAKAPNAVLQDQSNLLKLPLPAQFAAQNYNHQFEAPVLFYVLSIMAMMGGVVDSFLIGTAWLYVGLRVVHAIIHCTYNKVMHRFMVFSISMLVLIVMALYLVFQL